MVAVLFIACLALTHISVLSKEIHHSSRARNIFSEEITQSEIELNSEDAGSHISVKNIEANRLLARRRDENTKFPREVIFRIFATCVHSGNVNKKPRLIESKRRWKRFWKVHCESNPARTSSSPRPKIKFSTNAVIAIVSREVTGGCELKVTSIKEKRKRVNVAFEECVPFPGASVSDVITHLYHFVEIPKMRKKKPKFFKTVVTMTAPSQTPTEKFTDMFPIDMEYETIAKGVHSGIVERSTQVISNKNQWSTLWKEHKEVFNHHREKDLLPVIDFEQYTVISITPGERPTSGYSVRFIDIQEYSQHVEITFTEDYPLDGEIVLFVLTQPYHFVKIRKVNKTNGYTFQEVAIDYVPPTMAPTIKKGISFPLDMKYETIAKGVHSGIVERSTQVISNKNQWSTLWKEHKEVFNHHREKDLLPVIDFEQYTIISITSGERPTSGYSVRFIDIQEYSQHVEITFTEDYPYDEEVLVLQVLTQPYHFVKIRKVNKTNGYTFQEVVIDYAPPAMAPTIKKGISFPLDMKYETIAEGVISGIYKPMKKIIITQQEWSTLWEMHTNSSTISSMDATSIPYINFEESAVIALASGQRSTSGYSVEVEEVLEFSEIVHIVFTQNFPHDEEVLQVLTQPFQFVKIPRLKDAKKHEFIELVVDYF